MASNVSFKSMCLCCDEYLEPFCFSRVHTFLLFTFLFDFLFPPKRRHLYLPSAHASLHQIFSKALNGIYSSR